jgi:hypothetical protein
MLVDFINYIFVIFKNPGSVIFFLSLNFSYINYLQQIFIFLMEQYKFNSFLFL